MNRQHDIEPYWQDEDDWPCTVEFLPSDDLEGRVFAADIVGYLFGYAQLANPNRKQIPGRAETLRCQKVPFTQRVDRSETAWVTAAHSGRCLVPALCSVSPPGAGVVGRGRPVPPGGTRAGFR